MGVNILGKGHHFGGEVKDSLSDKKVFAVKE